MSQGVVAMFGYVVPLEPELKVCELARYKAYYCGLCDELGKLYSLPARAAHSYDMAFLAMLLSGVEEDGRLVPSRCALKPFSRKKPKADESPCLEFAADLGATLFCEKLRDDRRDGGGLRSTLVHSVYGGCVKRAMKRAPELYGTVRAGIDELVELEKSRSDELDAPADAFGRMMKSAVAMAPVRDKDAKRAICAAVYNLGKWIYLADAWEDRKADSERGCYNVFNITEAGADRAEFLMLYSLREAYAAAELVEMRFNGGIVLNILGLGCVEKTRLLLGGNS